MNGIEDYKTFLTKVSEETGIAAFKPNEDGFASMRVDDAYNVNFQFVEATGKVLCFIEVAELPPDAPKAVYRDLLAGVREVGNCKEMSRRFAYLELRDRLRQ